MATLSCVNAFRHLRVCGVAIAIAHASSCATSEKLASKVREASLLDLRPARVGVVEVREHDLKNLPSGEERLVAYQRSNRFFHGFVPAHFQEPDLPREATLMDGGLLPNLD